MRPSTRHMPAALAAGWLIFLASVACSVSGATAAPRIDFITPTLIQISPGADGEEARAEGPFSVRYRERGNGARVDIGAGPSNLVIIECMEITRPKTVRVDGRLLTSWSYDSDGLRAVLRVPVRAGAATLVEIDRGPNSALRREEAVAWRDLAGDLADTARLDPSFTKEPGGDVLPVVRRAAHHIATGTGIRVDAEAVRQRLALAGEIRTRIVRRLLARSPTRSAETAISVLTSIAPGITVSPEDGRLVIRAVPRGPVEGTASVTWEAPADWTAVEAKGDGEAVLALTPPVMGAGPAVAGVTLRAPWNGLTLRFHRTISLFPWARTFAILGPVLPAEHPERDLFRPVTTYRGPDGPVRWRAVMGPPTLSEWDQPYALDVASVCGAAGESVVYAALRMKAAAVTDALLWVGVDHGATVWLNGHAVASVPPDSQASVPSPISAEPRAMTLPTEHKVPLQLRAGSSYLLLKVPSGAGLWRLSVRFTDRRGAALPDLSVSAPVG